MIIILSLQRIIKKKKEKKTEILKPDSDARNVFKDKIIIYKDAIYKYI
jgi:hypothetical protein